MTSGKRYGKTSRAGRKQSRVRETRAQTRYLESSAILAALLERDTTARGALLVSGRYVTSALTVAEVRRGVVRARAAGRLTAEQERDVVAELQAFEASCDVVAVADPVLDRVGRPFPVEPVRTLDAIHLATAELLDEPPQLVTIVTRDRRVRDNARAMGFAVE